MEQNQNAPVAETKPGRQFSPALMFALDFLKVVIIALAIILPIRYFIFQPFIVQGSSMEPNFSNGQYLIIDEISYRFQEPKRGDVLVLVPPRSTTEGKKEYFIKRVIGLPGEKIEIDNGKITIFNEENPDGKVLEESYLPSQGLTFPHNSGLVGGKKILELNRDEYFMMGDNRLASSDSRDWGPLKRDDIVGKVFVRALPITEFDRFQTPSYDL